jgi:branched-chain amino acid transport system permease protein
MKTVVNPRLINGFTRGFVLAMPVVAAGVIVTLFLGPASERICIVFLISLMVVVGIGVYSGNSGILSFGHLSFMAIGAYVSGILTISVSLKKMSLPMLPEFLKGIEIGLAPSILVVICITVIFAWLSGKLISRLEGSAAAIATLGFLIIVHGIIIAAREFTRGSQSFFGVPRDTHIVACILLAALMIIAARMFRDSLSGLQLRASRDEIAAASAIGIDARKRRLQAWILSAVMVALAGVMLGHFLGTFSPKKFYFVDTFALLAMLIIGGMESVSGAIFGTILITIVSELLRHLESGIVIFGIETPEVFGTTQIGIGRMGDRSGAEAGIPALFARHPVYDPAPLFWRRICQTGRPGCRPRRV